MTDIDNSADYLDIRDIIARIEELEAERELLADEQSEAQTDLTLASHGDGDTTGELTERANSADDALIEWDNDNSQELASLTAFIDQFKGCGGDEEWRGDWYPITLIRDSYFEDAMDEMVADCYNLDVLDIPSFVTLTINYRALQMDYTSAEFDGVTYWAR